ncbi:hypothetical protein AX774_g3184 [Zancudomyces culisetae]|uniref:Retrovirus-related Pol polyprotein from transposon n=1 Tax=Zancudomyces culisetae TaxID=1213189 RepID=A0A1R1PR05_ZANCU|nr:hypothetical protein AX774_g3184 [Zancudomyces culisetae]|eukprot:OMH83312.1 hypothetical protein AX774_g3184 [Zancudomyces culisetae]
MVSKSTGFTPSEMLYGTNITLPAAWTWHSTNEEDILHAVKRIKLIKDKLPQLRKLGVRRGVAAKNSEQTRYNKKVKEFLFQVGHKVLKLVESEKGKLEDLWEGPYTILKCLTKGTYLICDDYGNRDLVNGDKLKLYFSSTSMVPSVSNRMRSKFKTFNQGKRYEDIHA